MKERISSIIQALGITKSKFAETLNVSPAFVSQMCSGAGKPSERTISDICGKFGVNPEWLKTGEGEMFLARNYEEEVAYMVGKVLGGSNNFQKAVVRMICSRNEQELEALEAAFRAVVDGYEKL